MSGRKRGELSGVRIDAERVEVFLPPKEPVLADGQWGTARDAADASEQPARADAHTESQPADMEGSRRTARRSDRPPPIAAAEHLADGPGEAPATQTTRTRAMAAAGDDGGASAGGAGARPSPQALQPTLGPAANRLDGPAQTPLGVGVTASAPRADATPVGRSAAAAEPRMAAPSANTSGLGLRPPVLASEALLRDLLPAKPAPLALPTWCFIFGASGALATFRLTGAQGMGLPLISAFAALLLLGLARMPYAGRAAAVATIAATGLGLVVWVDMSNPDGDVAVALTLSVMLLATGLYYRAWHRSSLMSRLLVLFGVLAGMLFLGLSGEFSELTMVDTAWQSWAPRLLGLPFGLLLMLALLAFMDSRTTAAAGVWATSILVWYWLHTCVELLRTMPPSAGRLPELHSLARDRLLLELSGPIFTALLALSLAQMLAAARAQRWSASRTGLAHRPT